ncbi:MAG: SpoIIE family protein phosphatase [Clostridia bacterium]|nr:SpoIIE family protein phosphatase [Clostridia bacterium]
MIVGVLWFPVGGRFETAAGRRQPGCGKGYGTGGDGTGKGKERRGIGLGSKLNLTLIVSILLVSLGLLRITYTVYCRKMDALYFDQTEYAARAAVNQYLPYGYVMYLKEMTRTDAFREVYARAAAQGDEGIIREWMLAQPTVDYEQEFFERHEAEMTEEEKQEYTLYGVYRTLVKWFTDAKSVYSVRSLYIQYVEDGVTYNLMDPDENLLVIGTAEAPIEAFAAYTGNDRVPPIVYPYGDSWLCTACEPVMEEVNGGEIAIAQVCADVDLTDVYRERHWFLMNSALIVTLFTLAAIAVSLLLTRQLVTKPLKLLAGGATAFAKGDEGFSRDDILRLPIRQGDEIGDLYREIQSMQERIVDNADTLTRVTAERERVSTELNMAARIQSAMLPTNFPAFPDRPEFDLYAGMAPAKEVGGDFYDFFMMDDDHLALVIADVSDKGVPAALFMMSAKTILRFRARMGGTPGEILASVNAQLCANNEMKMFVTVWLGILEISTGCLSCVNAGHEYPFIRSRGTFRVYRDRHCMMAGAMKNAKFTDYTLQLEPGDALFVYTDGVPEANDASGGMYGMERLNDTLNRAAAENPEGIVRAVRADVDAFTAGADPFDDLTLLCLEYRGRRSAEGVTA